MTDTLRTPLEQALWSTTTGAAPGVWAIVDCARNPKIYGALLESRLEFRCLYSGRLPRALEMHAPQLVELLPGHRLTTRLLGEGWGDAWGIYLRIADPSNLRHHLRRFLKVRDEDGRRLLFRYYDPRVLRAFLPTCTPEQLQQIFGPIDSFVVEDADAGAVEFRLTRGRLQRRALLRSAAEI